MPIYLSSSALKGSVSLKGYEQAVELLATEFSIKRDIARRVGALRTREAAIPIFNDITVCKFIDKASTGIMAYALKSESIPEISLIYCSVEQEVPLPYLSYTLSDVMLSRYKVLGDYSDQVQEEFCLNFNKIHMQCHSRDARGRTEQVAAMGYDLGQACLL